MGNYGEDFGGRRNTRIGQSLNQLNEKYNLGFKRIGNRFEIPNGRNKPDDIGCFCIAISIISIILFIFSWPHKLLDVMSYTALQTTCCIFFVVSSSIYYFLCRIKTFMVFDFKSSSFYLSEKLFFIRIRKDTEIPFSDIKFIGITTKFNESALFWGDYYNAKYIAENGITEEFIEKEKDSRILSSVMIFQTNSGELFEVSEDVYSNEEYDFLDEIAIVLSEAIEVPLLSCERNERIVEDQDSEIGMKIVPLLDEEDLAFYRRRYNNKMRAIKLDKK